MKKAFITGATGNIGGPLVKYLNEWQIPFTSGSRSEESDNPSSVKIDLDDVESLKSAFDGHYTLFLLTPDSEHSRQWVANALEAAKAVNMKHVIRSSGIGADASSPYFVFSELGKMEDLVKSSGLDYTIVQPNSFFQNFATFQNQTIKNGTVFLPHEDASVSYVDVRDVALAIAHIIKNPSAHLSESYVITGPAAITDQELLDEIGNVLNKSIKYVSVTDEDMTATFRKYHMPEHNIRQLISLYQADRAGETSIVSNDFEHITGSKKREAKDFARDYQRYWE